MKRILIYYYTEEISVDSTTSVARLIASLIEGWRQKHQLYYFTFKDAVKTSAGKDVIPIKIPTYERIKRKLNNQLGLKRIHWFDLKRAAAARYIAKTNLQFDVVFVLGLDDVGLVRDTFPDAYIFYWIHNISAICKPEYLRQINYADFLLSPSRTTYRFILQELQPKPLLSQFHFFPNWCEDIFSKVDDQRVGALKLAYGIKDDTITFIHSGGDHPIKGKKLLQQVLRQAGMSFSREIVFFFAGGKAPANEYREGNIRVIELGTLTPSELAPHYQLAKFGCFSSLAYDHCPLVLLEMVFCGVLPIASNVGSVEEILGAGYDFLVNEPHAPKNWEEVIRRAIHLDDATRNNTASELKSKISSIYNRASALKMIDPVIESC